MKALVFTLLFFIALTGSAWAQETFDQSVDRGKSAYQTGDYKEAIDAFLAAYKTRPTASLLYNIGRSYDASGDLENAEVYYERFVNAPGITQESRADAVGRLKTVRDIKQMKAADKKRESDAKGDPNKKDAPPLGTEEEASASISPVTWVLLGLGVASIGGGVVTGVLSQSKFDEIEDLGYPNEVNTNNLATVRETRDSGQSLKITSVALMSGGALLVAGGVVTYFVMKSDGSSDDSGSAWKVQPTLAPTSAGLQLFGKW